MPTHALSGNALDVVVSLLFEFDERSEGSALGDRICEAICRLTSLERD